MSLGYALIFTPNAENMSGYSSMRQERYKIGSCAAGTLIEPDNMPSLSGKNCTKPMRGTAYYSIRQESSAGAKRSDITMRTNLLLSQFRRIARAIKRGS